MMNSKLLKTINYVSITITLGLTILFLVNWLGNPIHRNDPRFFVSIPYLITQPILLLFSFIITIKTNPQKGVMLFALFLSMVSQDFVMQYLRMIDKGWIPIELLAVNYGLTGLIYIKSLQFFPRQLSKQDIPSVFLKSKMISRYISWTLNDYTWFVFPILIAGAGYLNINNTLIDVFILLTALLNLSVNFKKSNATERNKILWLFWGLTAYTLLTILRSIIYFQPMENVQVVRLVFSTLMTSVLVLSLSMSLFFSNTFDTGILIKRTIVNGFLFILIVLTYNTIEHYFLHWLSHELGLSDVFLSSLLSGIFILAFSPLHHKFMNYLDNTFDLKKR